MPIPIAAVLLTNSRALRHGDFHGDQVSVALYDDGVVEMVGNEGGVVRLAPVDIERVRVGYVESKHGRMYCAKIWRADGSGTLEILPEPREWVKYRDFMRLWSRFFLNTSHQSKFELGTSRFMAILLPALFFPLAVGTLVLAIFVLRREPWWGRMIVPILPVALFVISLGGTVTTHWPRGLQSLEGLARQLPR